MKNFSDRVMSYLNMHKGKEFYIYCLVDSRNNKDEIFYIGKGKGNRVFNHEKAAFNKKLELILENEDKAEDLKINRIRDIKAEGFQIKKVIINYWLSEREAFASENTLINLFNFFSDINLTNKVNGHGVRGIEVSDLERQFGSVPLSINEIQTNKLILAVKITDSLQLDKDETYDYSFYDRDDQNIKSRTLGNWVVAKDNAEKVKYILGINTGIDNTVVSAYEVSGFESGIDEKGRRRFCFHSKSQSENTMKVLGVYQRALYDLKFGNGQSIVYINKHSNHISNT
ncbi:LEM-3-like GIY-YIG domain-containing protein [Pisciglobus halotolerans]|uniref:GIY-YIG domain-containing protein n=1 Tax=Pisciglobus halotolerans TaxID=745365 RepID=A0A1I3DNY8_9LACT|nr:hypothetical protein [Pisciglobus halotolerans]SFH88191.1 hypothetical protein SAMN04489868_14510 [Pisciglobus halotolerans]